MQKWEYCVITGVTTFASELSGKYPKLTYFFPRGFEKQIDLGNKAASQRPKGMEKVSEGEYIASVVAQLGMEGWEMVSAVNEAPSDSSRYSIYFRRPIE